MKLRPSVSGGSNGLGEGGLAFSKARIPLLFAQDRQKQLRVKFNN